MIGGVPWIVTTLLGILASTTKMPSFNVIGPLYPAEAMIAPMPVPFLTTPPEPEISPMPTMPAPSIVNGALLIERMTMVAVAPVFAKKVCAPLSVIARLKVCVTPLTVMPLVKRIGFPPNVYVPPSTVIERKVVKRKKLLLFACCAPAAGKTRSSFATGAELFNQLAAVCQFASVPLPVHVLVAA